VNRLLVSRAGALLALLMLPAAAEAQSWPAETPSLAGGRITFGGECTLTASPDDRGRFNYTDYERDVLQLVRVALTAAVRPVDRVTFVTELTAEGDTSGGNWSATPYALYVRVRPWRTRPIDIQAGRIPPVFGVGGRRVYASSNVLIGYPLIWQYLTILRPDAIPANADELLYARDGGWKSGYSIGASDYSRGVPLATAFRYDTGVEVRVGEAQDRVSVAGAFTAGTLSSPGPDEKTGGPQISARVAVRPAFGLVLGASFADGNFLADSVENDLPGPARLRRHNQQSWGADAEYSRGYWLVRAETIVTSWSLPPLGTPSINTPLRAAGVSVEGLYRFAPGLSGAVRFDHVGFNAVTGRYETMPWDAPVTRVEAGVAWTIVRHVTARVSVQHNQRQRGLVTSSTLPSAQVTLWF
jgi:hypothetical protein